jgi:hypothetical protein
MKYAQSVCMKNVENRWMDFHWILCLRILRKIVELSKFLFILDNLMTALHDDLHGMAGNLVCTGKWLSHYGIFFKRRIKTLVNEVYYGNDWSSYLILQDWWCEIIAVNMFNVSHSCREGTCTHIIKIDNYEKEWKQRTETFFQSIYVWISSLLCSARGGGGVLGTSGE